MGADPEGPLLAPQIRKGGERAHGCVRLWGKNEALRPTLVNGKRKVDSACALFTLCSAGKQWNTEALGSIRRTDLRSGVW